SSRTCAQRVTRLQGRRLIDAADQPLQPKRETASLFLREEAPQLALTAVRLDREPARVQARIRAAKFNLRPMPREHELNGMRSVLQLDADTGIGDGDCLSVMAPIQARLQSPAEEQHLQPCEGQHGPEATAGHDACDREGDETGATEEQE